MDVGTIISMGSEAIPDGYLECNGASLLRADYADLFDVIGTAWGAADGTHFNLPDLRGKFPRGWDHGIARDPDRASRSAQAAGGQTGDHVGTVQNHQFYAHTHSHDGAYTGDCTTTGSSHNMLCHNWGTTSDPEGGNETRPINAGVMYCIKYM
jgi:microcystin-dependent protein